MSVTVLNPLQNAKDHMAFVMEFLVQVTGESVPDSVQAKAKEVLLPLVETQPDLSIVSAVAAFEQVPELQHFAAQLRKVSLPGAFGKYFASSDISCLAKGMDQPAVLYVYRCDSCGHRGETHRLGDDHDGAGVACSACGVPVKLEWDGGVTLRAENKQD